MDIDYKIHRTSETRKRFFSEATITVWTFTVLSELMARLFQEYPDANTGDDAEEEGGQKKSQG